MEKTTAFREKYMNMFANELLSKEEFHKFVGGKVEKGETKEQALIRECEEELAITVKPHRVFIEVTHEYPDIIVHLTLFNCTVLRGQPQLLEHNAMAWITPNEIPNYNFCPADMEILKKIIDIEILREGYGEQSI